MAWIVVVVGCFTTYCAEIYWKEDFTTYVQCNETLPMIYAELTAHRVKIEEIECISYDEST